MNKYQTAKHDSYQLVVKESKNNPDSINLIPKFSKGIDQLDGLNQKINAIRMEQEKDLTGITTDKDNILSELTDFILDISGAIFSYAQDTSNNSLMEKVNYKLSAIEKMGQSELVSTANIIYTEASKISAENLTNEGISADELKEFETLINEFKNIKTTPREAIIDRSSHTDKLAELFKEAGALVKNSLDRLAPQFKRKDPVFYLKYKAARNIIYSRPQKEKTAELAKNLE